MDGAGKRPIGPRVQGFLCRRIMGGNMKSKKKWFVLTGRRLQSFKTEQDFINGNVFMDCIDLMELQAVRALTSQGHAKNAFEIVTRNKSVVFQSTTPETSAEWLAALKQVMMLRFSESADLPEEVGETKKIEDELQRRKSTLKFWRNSRASSSHHSVEEDDVMNSFNFLAEEQDDEAEEEERDMEDVFNGEDGDQHSADPPVDVRPTSTSSGVDSTSVEEAPDYDVPTTHPHSEDEGIGETTDEPTSEETFEQLYQNIPPASPRRKSTPAIDELKELVHFGERTKEQENGISELKGIEQLRELLASMP